LVLGKEHFYLLFSSVATSFLSLTAKSGIKTGFAKLYAIVFVFLTIWKSKAGAIIEGRNDSW